MEKFQKSDGKSVVIELDEAIEKNVDMALKDIEKNRLDRAEKILVPLFNTHPDNHYVNYGMGSLFAFKNENEKAKHYFKKAIAAFPYFVEAYYNLGIVYYKDFDIANGLKAFQKVLLLGDPDDYIVREARRLCKFIEKLIADVNGTDVDTFLKAQGIFSRGVELMKKAEWEQAINAFKESLTINNSTPQPHGNMGICYAKLGKKEEAIKCFDQALAIDPYYELALVNKAFMEKLAPGEVLDGQPRIIEYYKEYGINNKSYIKDLIEEVEAKLGKPVDKNELEK